MDAWVSDPSANTAGVANTWVNGPYMQPVRTDFCKSSIKPPTYLFSL